MNNRIFFQLIISFVFLFTSVDTMSATGSTKDAVYENKLPHAQTTVTKETIETIKLDNNAPRLVSVYPMPDRNEYKVVRFKLVGAQDSRPITLTELKKVHSQKIHLLIIDETLEDYQHIHPLATSEPGVYEFEWRPKKDTHYRLWLDIVSAQTNKQEYLMAEMPNTAVATSTAVISRDTVLHHKTEQYTFNLSFDTPTLRTGQAAMGDIKITDKSGNPVTDLEPIMGAFAHIVAFNEDFKTIVHIHPMGPEPVRSNDRGGPDLTFHIEPEYPGFIKLFVQVKIKGTEIFVPFGLNVQPRKLGFKLRFGMESYDKPL